MQVNDSTKFSYTMHCKHWSSNIYRPYASLSPHQRPNCASTGCVISDDKILQGNFSRVAKLTQQSQTHWVSCIPLVCIYFGYNSSLNVRCVLSLMFFSVIWVHCVGHVSRDKNWLSHCSVVIFFRTFVIYDTVLNSLSNFLKHVWVCSLSWLWTYFFMVEKHDHLHLRIVFLCYGFLTVSNERVKGYKTAY